MAQHKRIKRILSFIWIGKFKFVDLFLDLNSIETVVLLCRKHIDAEKQISVTIEAEDGWRADKPVKATYSQIKDWVAKHYNGMKVHTLYIAQVLTPYESDKVVSHRTTSAGN